MNALKASAPLEWRRGRDEVHPLLGGKWRLERCIGKGGTAAVYLASHHNNGRRAAIKVLSASLSQNAGARARFFREGRTANLIDHPRVVAVLDDGITPDGRPFLVLELLEGKTLDARRKESPHGRLPLEEASRIVLDILDVLAHAHARGVVHRDLKPANVFLTRKDGAKLLDFGAAGHAQIPSEGSVTRLEIVVGTMLFAAPEQTTGGAIHPTADVWACGVLLYLLLSGKYPIGVLEEASYIAACSRGAPRLDGVPVEVANVVAKALSFDPKDRWKDARAMQLALAAALDHVGGLTPPKPPDCLRRSASLRDVDDEPTQIIPLPSSAELSQSRTTPAWTVAGPMMPAQPEARESTFFVTAFVLLAVMATVSMLTSFLHH